VYSRHNHHDLDSSSFWPHNDRWSYDDRGGDGEKSDRLTPESQRASYRTYDEKPVSRERIEHALRATTFWRRTARQLRLPLACAVVVVLLALLATEAGTVWSWTQRNAWPALMLALLVSIAILGIYACRSVSK
jgi:hypothetical protein